MVGVAGGGDSAGLGVRRRRGQRCAVGPSRGRGGIAGGRGRRHEDPDGLVRVEGKAVVEQPRGLLPRPDREDVGGEQGDREPAAVAFGAGDEGLPGVVGVAGLTAEGAVVAVEQLVVVADRERGMVAGFIGAAGLIDVAG